MLLDELRFNGGVVVVTGAGTGIGRASCEAFAELGARLVLVGRTLATLRETEKRIAGRGADAVSIVADVTKETDVARLRDEVAERFGSVKALVNNAGNNFRASITELSPEKWHELIDVDLTSVYLMTRAFMPLLEAAAPGASIVNVASIFGLMGPAEMPVYSAAKGGVIALTRQLAVDYGRKGVRVNAICPGPILTERVRGYYADGKRDMSAVANAVVLGRMGEPGEIGNVIAFVASNAASYLHGASVVVDGGRTIR
jgi:NAD(P)-dependent dehydrogenase (short-subunit alcohol dehydrogenase family)